MALASSKVSSISGLSLSNVIGNDLRKPIAPSLRLKRKWGSRNVTVCATTVPLTGVIFEPFEEVKKDALAVPSVPQVSLARQNYADECESAINEQIK